MDSNCYANAEFHFKHNIIGRYVQQIRRNMEREKRFGVNLE